MSKAERLARVEALLQRLDAAVVVRDPGNARAAEQFEGLRKQIALAAKNHRVHVAHLLSLSDSAKKGASAELLGERINDFLTELGVIHISEYIYPELFEVVETVDGESDGVEVLEEAVVEKMESGEFNRLRLGKVRMIRGPQVKNPISVDSGNQGLLTETHDVHTDEEDAVRTTPSRLRLGVIAVGFVVLGMLLGRIFFDGDDKEIDKSPTSTTVALDSSPTSTTVVGG